MLSSIVDRAGSDLGLMIMRKTMEGPLHGQLRSELGSVDDCLPNGQPVRTHRESCPCCAVIH
jgi:hypothetical protein